MTLASANNLILFPVDRIVRGAILGAPDAPEPPDIQAADRVILQKEALCRIVDREANRLLMELNNSGINLHTEGFDKNFSLSIECLRATVYQTLGIPHPLAHAMADLIESIDKIREAYDNEADTDEPEEPIR